MNLNMYFNRRRSAFAVAVFCLTANPALAAGPSPAGSGFQMLFGMVAVLGILMGLAWWLKRFGPVRGGTSAAAKIVGGVSVGTRERVMVIEVADQWIVVGVAPGAVQALATMPRQEIPNESATQKQPAANFSEWLKQTIEKRNAKN